MFFFFTAIFLIALPYTVTQWQCIFCYYPYQPQPYPYVYPDFYPFYPPIITPATPVPSYSSIGPCVNGQCPTGHGCYNSQCVPVSNNLYNSQVIVFFLFIVIIALL
ncbi:putative integral membrane protein [Brugia pahangi]